MEIPKKNIVYNVFDDGKISPSRKYLVQVKEVIPFKDIDAETLTLWGYEVKTCYWLYKPETDFFIKTRNEYGKDEIFVRTLNNGWFSIGPINGGRLDIDGELTKQLNY
jgi:N6-adenosine-specific RNA methylase IME4